MASQLSETNPTTRCGEKAYTSAQRLFHTHQVKSEPATVQVVLPPTSTERLSSSTEETILYLAYGSNLSAETFKGTRGIKPLSAINVHVPSLSLTFDLAGFPYVEPCFANTKYRTVTPPPAKPPQPPQSSNDYHKDRWDKGLVGVVYEVTPEDYRTIIASEGGGASYQDIVVPCFALAKHAKLVDPSPSGPSFIAHTLLQPRSSCTKSPKKTARVERPDPSYSQPSARYLKLITSGGEEHGLPDEYLAYLYNIRPYRITTTRQRIGKALFIPFWVPFVAVVIILGKIFANDQGRIPSWLIRLNLIVFSLMWTGYDAGFKQMFGDGERTVGETDHDDTEFGWSGSRWNEKSRNVI